jgi:hypothetical protein
MNVADTAVMVLLMCSPAGTDCMEIQSERSWQSVADCRQELGPTLRRLSAGADRHVTGRCALADDLGIDPIVTGSAKQTASATTVLVTRPVGGRTSSVRYVVPSEEGEAR